VTLPVTPEAYAGGRREGDGGATAVVQNRGARASHRRTLAVLGLTLVAYAALALGYATLTPIWQNPDEPAHYNYVAFVAQTGGLPVLQPGDWDSALLERLKNGRLQPGDSVASIRYEAWQPPLFYLAAAPLLRLGPTDDPAGLVLRLRIFDVVLGALTLGLALLSAREILPPHLAVVVPLAMVGIPMFTAVSAAISADPLANLLAASVLLVLLRRLRFRGDNGPGETYMPLTPMGGPSLPQRTEHGFAGSRWAFGAGVLLGLGLLTKLALGIFVPIALLTLFLRSSRPMRDAALMLGAIGLVVLPWLVHQVTSYGWADPLATSRHAAVVLDQQRFPGFSPGYLLSFLTTSFHSFWAQFGWMGLVAPPRLYWVWGLLGVVALGGLALERRRLHERSWRLLLATLGAAIAAYIAYNLTFEQPQGRYLFTALVPIAMLLVLGWAAWLPRRFQAWGLILVGIGLLGLNAYALARVLVPGFAPTG
jgi:4-amino-4-deoxy-L-arabinose transferase-like glycosyltransferase